MAFCVLTDLVKIAFDDVLVETAFYIYEMLLNVLIQTVLGNIDLIDLLNYNLGD